MQECVPLYLRELRVKQANTTLRSNTKNLLQIPHINLKRFGDRAFCPCAKLQETAENIATCISKGVYLTIWTINNCPLTFFKALLNIIGGKGAISILVYQLLVLPFLIVIGLYYPYIQALMFLKYLPSGIF